MPLIDPTERPPVPHFGYEPPTHLASESAWRRRGRTLIPGVTPVATATARPFGAGMSPKMYGLYSRNQTRAAKSRQRRNPTGQK